MVSAGEWIRSKAPFKERNHFRLTGEIPFELRPYRRRNDGSLADWSLTEDDAWCLTDMDCGQIASHGLALLIQPGRERAADASRDQRPVGEHRLWRIGGDLESIRRFTAGVVVAREPA